MAKIPKNRKSKEYWANRDKEEAAWIAQNLANDEQFNGRLQGYYDEAIANINKEIDANYESLSKRGISREAVSQMDVETYQSEAAKIVKEASQMRKAGHKVTYADFSDEVNTRMRVYNATMRINRLEYLKSQVGLEMVRSGMRVDNAMREKLTNDYISEVKRQSGILGVSAQPSMWTNKKVAKVVMAQTNSSTFSKRIWANQDVLKARLDEVITSGVIRGDSPSKMARRLREQVRDTVNNQRYVTERIARTESARVQFKVQMEQISRNGYRYVKWFAEPKACAECSRIYRVNNGYGEGVYKIYKVPQIPVHPNCRCSISPTWVKGQRNMELSDKEQAALNRYISSMAYTLNQSLRNGKVSKQQRNEIDGLDSALVKMPLYDGDEPLQRDYFFANAEQTEDFVQQMDNSWFQDPAYISTSKIHYGEGAEQVHVIIKNSKSGRDISEFNSNEQEVLFPRNTKFKIEEFYVDKNGILTVVWSE